MFVFNRKKGLTICYYTPVAYKAFTGLELKGKGALCQQTVPRGGHRGQGWLTSEQALV